MSSLIYQYWFEFVTIATVHLFAVASPGPDFAIVLKHSVQHGRRIAVITSLGIAVGIFVHVAYSLVGIGLLIKATPWLFNVLLIVAAAYLIWLGVGALRSSGQGTRTLEEADNGKTLSAKGAFTIGFITNGINPKATLFFLSVFAAGVAATTPNYVKAFYGFYMAIATAIWFCGLSYLLGSYKVRNFINQNSRWFDRLMGAVLILLALKLIVTSMV